MQLVCQRCNKARATVHLVDLDPSGEKHEHHFCDACAAAEGLMSLPHEPINAILQKFIAGVEPGKGTSVESVTCPECGMTPREFRKRGLLGCANDYRVFESFLVPLLERAHEGATEHIGKVPSHAGASARKRTQLLRLKRQLSESVSREDYETAATLKREIEALEPDDAG